MSFRNKKNTAVPLVAPKICLRIRPEAKSGGHAQHGEDAHTHGKELQGWDESSVSVGWSCSSATDPGKALEKAERYSYMNRVFPPSSTQRDVYEELIPPMVDKILGFSSPSATKPTEKVTDAMLFAYGQTGTGKTWTTVGPDYSLREGSAPSDGSVDERWGCFPRIAYAIFERMRKSEAARPFVLSLSAVEFYLFQANDLLASNRPVTVSNEDFFPIGARQIIINSPEEVIPLIVQARKARHTRHTRMNNVSSDDPETEHSGSSRGHACFTLTVTQLDHPSGGCAQSCFNLFDMAGAERPDKTGEARLSASSAMDEIRKGQELGVGATAFFINWELFCLADLILKASEFNVKKKGTEGYKPKALLNTAALKVMGACLNGSCDVAMVITLSQAPQCGWETWFSCKWGRDMSALRTPLRGKPMRQLSHLLKRSQEEVSLQQAAIDRCGGCFTAPRIGEARRALLVHHQHQILLLEHLISKTGSGPEENTPESHPEVEKTQQ